MINKLFFLLLVLIMGCSNPVEQEKISTTPVPNAEVQHIEDDVFKATLLDSIVNVKVILFSDSNFADTFRLVVPAGKISDTQSTFTITSATGKVLFQQVFDSWSIGSGYNLPENPTKEDKALLTQNSAYSFFNDGRFMNVTDNELLNQSTEEDFLDYAVWKEVKQLPGHRLYLFGLGEEDTNYLVYSPRFEKVVSIRNCC